MCAGLGAEQRVRWPEKSMREIRVGSRSMGVEITSPIPQYIALTAASKKIYTSVASNSGPLKACVHLPPAGASWCHEQESNCARYHQQSCSSWVLGQMYYQHRCWVLSWRLQITVATVAFHPGIVAILFEELKILASLLRYSRKKWA